MLVRLSTIDCSVSSRVWVRRVKKDKSVSTRVRKSLGLDSYTELTLPTTGATWVSVPPVA